MYVARGSQSRLRNAAKTLGDAVPKYLASDGLSRVTRSNRQTGGDPVGIGEHVIMQVGVAVHVGAKDSVAVIVVLPLTIGEQVITQLIVMDIIGEHVHDIIAVGIIVIVDIGVPVGGTVVAVAPGFAALVPLQPPLKHSSAVAPDRVKSKAVRLMVPPLSIVG